MTTPQPPAASPSTRACEWYRGMHPDVEASDAEIRRLLCVQMVTLDIAMHDLWEALRAPFTKPLQRATHALASLLDRRRGDR
jgi:hypothetical protein